MNKTAKWTAAILLSLSVHAGAAILLLPSADPLDVSLEGAEVMEVAVLGNAFENALEAGVETAEIAPVEEPVEEMTPVEPETEQALSETIAPAETSDIVSEVPPDVIPSEADVILPAEEMPPVAAEAPEVVASIPPAATVVPEEMPERPPEPEKAEAPPERKVEPKKPEPEKAEPEKPRKTPPRRKAGDKGQQEQTADKGRADGSAAKGASASDGKQGSPARQAGNAAVSNYKGKVQSKLERAFRRYPAEARRANLKGTAHVRFTLTASGAVSGASIARSAGSPILDQAALETVRRASPFPPIPDGRPSWTFTIPLVFNR